jgi:ribosomal protein L24
MSSDVNYEKEPVEGFGLTIFKKLGWREGQAVGKRPREDVKIQFNDSLRPPRLGLGAEQPISKKKEMLSIGSKVLITRGKDKGMNAVLLDLVDQYAKLELPSGHIMTVTLSDIEPYIENTYTEEPLPDNSCRRRLRWVLPGIIVRVINKKIHKGRLYNLKLKVSDVLDDFRFTLLGKDSILYDDLSEKHVETVIPSTGSNVMILKGPHRASIGKLLERDRKRDFVIVHSEDGSTLNLRQDDISEVSLD